MENKPQDYYYKAIYRIATEIDSHTSTEDVLNGFVRSTARTIGVKGCSLMLLSPDGKQLVHVVAHGLSDSYIRKGAIRIDPILEKTLRGNPTPVIDAATDPRIQYKAQAIREGIVSMLSLPMVLRDEVIGVLRVYTGEPRQFSDDEIEFLKLIASLGAISLRKARQYESQEQYYEQCLQEKASQLDQATAELAGMEEAKSKLLAFISMVAHDLKAPLAAIQTYFGVMLGGYTGELNEKHRQMVEKSSLRIDALLELISDLLDISRIETGQIVHEMKEVSVSKLATEPIEDARRLAEHKGLTLVTDISREVPLIRGSAPRLQQAFTNLLSNAVKFTAAGGTVTLRLAHGDGEIVGEILDTGDGIPEDELPRIFEDFYRASNVNAPGTGLGLPIVKRIIEAHGGRIEAESPCRETGVGCRFIFRLPAGD